jgi:hypothetical protein
MRLPHRTTIAVLVLSGTVGGTLQAQGGVHRTQEPRKHASHAGTMSAEHQHQGGETDSAHCPVHAAHMAAADTAAGGAEHADTAFAALQKRGKGAMGVDQYTSTHRFDVLPDGGRIELQRDSDEAEGVAQIRRHMGEIAGAFAAGDFDIPMLVHMQEVPGTCVMKERTRMIQYTVRDLPRGAEVTNEVRTNRLTRICHPERSEGSSAGMVRATPRGSFGRSAPSG